MEEQVVANIIRRRRLDKSSTVYGIICLILLSTFGIQWLSQGKVPVIEEIARQIGLLDFMLLLEVITMLLLLFGLYRGIQAVRRTKVESCGTLCFHPDWISIEKGKLKFELHGKDLNALHLSLAQKQMIEHPKLKGGNILSVPSPDGTFSCEFDLQDHGELEKLTKIIDHLRAFHNIHVDVE